MATGTLEILTRRPDVEVIIVPIGGGSGAAGACIVAKSVRPGIEVIGVQSAQAPAAYLSWRDRRLLDSTCTTIAGCPTTIWCRLRAESTGPRPR